MQSKPLVSTVIPVYNCERHLAEAIESVLAQAYRPVEIIVVDDGSTDGTARVAASFKGNIHYIHQPNSGPAAARNKGLRTAQGNVIGFLDADDLWPKNKLELQLGHLTKNPALKVVMGLVQYTRISTAPESEPGFEEFSQPLVAFNLGSALFRRSVFEQIGLFDETMHYSEDVDWFMRARECGIPMVVLEQVTLFYRIHQHNMIRNKSARDLYFAKALKKSLDRRRQRGSDSVGSLPKLSYSNQPCDDPQNPSDC
jgi:glycosyltransferase involved in cell wall biosynthesis